MTEKQDRANLSYKEMVANQLQKDQQEQAEKQAAWLQEHPGGLPVQSQEEMAQRLEPRHSKEQAQASEHEGLDSAATMWERRTHAAVGELVEAINQRTLAEEQPQSRGQRTEELREAVEAKRQETIELLRAGKDELARAALQELGKLEREERQLDDQATRTHKQTKGLAGEQDLTIER